MFSLYIIISHNKLLKKSLSINENEIYNSILPIIIKRGGVVSEYSGYFSYFPSKYEYSRKNFIICLQELFSSLSENIDLVGFSIIIDSLEPLTEFEYHELRNRLVLKTHAINNIWFTKESYNLVTHLFTGIEYKSLIMVPDTFYYLSYEDDRINNAIIDNFVQLLFDSLTDSVSYFKSDMNIILFENIVYWADSSGFDKVFYIDFGFSCDRIITFIDYLITLRSIFDPNKDLNDIELQNWGRYVDLYNKFSSRSYDCFILDDALIHLNKLILLWLESFSMRYNTLFVLKYDNDVELNNLWSILSLLSNVKFFVFNNDCSDDSLSVIFPDLSNIEESPGDNIAQFLESKGDESLMILYLVILIHGSILIRDLLNILKRLDFNILRLGEELDNYRRIGYLLGDQYLYPGNNTILSSIQKIRSDFIDKWKNDFLGAFIDAGYEKIFSYSYTFCLIAINSSFKKKALDILYIFIQKILDLGRDTVLSTDFIDKSYGDKFLNNILLYKKIRESRLRNCINFTKNGNNIDTDCLYSTPLEFMDLLNLWSLNRDENLINRCKKLYFTYQTNGENFNESRIKILFSLGLLSIGSVSEAVDYFELNCSYSKSISDTYSYIRNGCFLSAALFVKGDISGVLRVSSLFLNHSWIYFKTRWLLYLQFIRVRALIEIGSYESALDIINSGLILAENFMYRDILKIYRNWKGRILYYLDRGGEAREVLLSNVFSNEGFYFLAEIEYYSGNISRAISYIEQVDITRDDTVLFDEKLKWRDGFFMIEEFFDRKNRSSVLFQEISNFKYFLNIINSNMDAFSVYYDVIKGISNNSLGIHDYRYIYYLYVATENMKEYEYFSRDNLLNKIVRLLQQRASNMTEHNQKHLYLNNFYNKPIMEMSNAKKFF